MRALMMLAWRNLSVRPGKTVASVLGVAVGIATVVSVLTVDHNTLLTQQSLRAPTEPDSDLVLQPVPGAFSSFEEMAEALRTAEDLRGIAGFARATYTLVAPEGRAGIELLAVEQEALTIHDGYAVAEGHDLDFRSDAPELLVSAGVAERVGLAVGDLVELVYTPRMRGPVVACRDGELVEIAPARGTAARGEQHEFRVAGILAPSRLGYPKNRVVCSLAVGRAVMGDRFKPQFWGNIRLERADFQTVEAGLRQRFVPFQPTRALAGLAPEEAAFRNGVRFCGFLSLFLGLYIIFNTMSMSLVERVQQIGLLRALGVTNGQLLVVFLLEGLMLALGGAALALLLAWGIVRAFVVMDVTTLGWGRPLVIHEVPWGPIGVVLGAGITFALLGVLYPFVRAARLSVIEALRRGVIELRRDPFTGVRRSLLLGILLVVPLAWFVGAPSDEVMPVALYRAVLLCLGMTGGVFALLLLAPGLLAGLADLCTRPFRGPAVKLARMALRTSRHRVFGTASGLMLVFAAIFLVLSVLGSLEAETRAFADRALAQRLFLKTGPLHDGALAELREVPGLRTLVPLNVETYAPFVVRGVDDRVLQLGSLSGDPYVRARFAGERTIVLSTRCADDYGYEAGDVVVLVTESDGPVGFEVLAVTDEYGFAPDERVFAVVSARNMKRYWCLTGEGLGDDFAAWAPDVGPGDLDQIRSEIAAIVGDENLLSLRRGEEITAGYLEDLERDFAIFYAILALTVLLAGVGILNAMVIAVMERRREIGLLRSIGLTGGQVGTMLLVESGVLGVLGGAFGLLLGIPLAIVVTRALTEVSHLELGFQMSPRTLGAVAVGAVVVSVLAVAYPALRANRLRLADVMRYE